KLNSQWHKAFDGKGKDSSGYQNAKRIETYFELATMMRLHWFLTALIDFPTQVAKDRTASAIEPIFHEKLSYLQDHKLFKKANLLESIERKKDRLEESLRSIPETSPLKAYAERYLHALEAALRYRMITTSDECRSPDLFQNYAVPDCICPLYEAPRPTPESSYVLYPASSSASAESAASAATPDAPRARPTIKREPPQFF
ncbi:MAG: hypothetical protein EBX40_08765, partial [Gammaproteobacteria bacterium]|nr:hypothetical protein [Gammaproteobacteria bacterium]